MKKKILLSTILTGALFGAMAFSNVGNVNEFVRIEQTDKKAIPGEWNETGEWTYSNDPEYYVSQDTIKLFENEEGNKFEVYDSYFEYEKVEDGIRLKEIHLFVNNDSIKHTMGVYLDGQNDFFQEDFNEEDFYFIGKKVYEESGALLENNVEIQGEAIRLKKEVDGKSEYFWTKDFYPVIWWGEDLGKDFTEFELIFFEDEGTDPIILKPTDEITVDKFMLELRTEDVEPGYYNDGSVNPTEKCGNWFELGFEWDINDIWERNTFSLFGNVEFNKKELNKIPFYNNLYKVSVSGEFEGEFVEESKFNLDSENVTWEVPWTDLHGEAFKDVEISLTDYDNGDGKTKFDATILIDKNYSEKVNIESLDEIDITLSDSNKTWEQELNIKNNDVVYMKDTIVNNIEIETDSITEEEFRISFNYKDLDWINLSQEDLDKNLPKDIKLSYYSDVIQDENFEGNVVYEDEEETIVDYGYWNLGGNIQFVEIDEEGKLVYEVGGLRPGTTYTLKNLEVDGNYNEIDSNNTAFTLRTNPHYPIVSFTIMCFMFFGILFVGLPLLISFIIKKQKRKNKIKFHANPNGYKENYVEFVLFGVHKNKKARKIEPRDLEMFFIDENLNVEFLRDSSFKKGVLSGRLYLEQFEEHERTSKLMAAIFHNQITLRNNGKIIGELQYVEGKEFSKILKEAVLSQQKVNLEDIVDSVVEEKIMNKEVYKADHIENKNELDADELELVKKKPLIEEAIRLNIKDPEYMTYNELKEEIYFQTKILERTKKKVEDKNANNLYKKSKEELFEMACEFYDADSLEGYGKIDLINLLNDED